MVSNASKVE
jgi:hypothetical protein